jgi:hypothetical protein
MHIAAGRGKGNKEEVLKHLTRTSERMALVPGPQEFRARMITAVAYGKIMCGCEVNQLSDIVLHRLRGVILKAIGGVLRHGDARATLLDYRQGAHEPVLVMGRRIVKAWIREESGLHVCNEFWKAAGQAVSPGPVGSLQKFLVRHGIRPVEPMRWRLPHGYVRLNTDHGVLESVL